MVLLFIEKYNFLSFDRDIGLLAGYESHLNYVNLLTCFSILGNIKLESFVITPEEGAYRSYKKSEMSDDSKGGAFDSLLLNLLNLVFRGFD